MAQASMTDMGQKIMLLGLFVQLLFFGFFVVISVIFYMRMRSSPQRHTIPQYGKYGWPALVSLSLSLWFLHPSSYFEPYIPFRQGNIH